MRPRSALWMTTLTQKKQTLAIRDLSVKSFHKQFTDKKEESLERLLVLWVAEGLGIVPAVSLRRVSSILTLALVIATLGYA